MQVLLEERIVNANKHMEVNMHNSEKSFNGLSETYF